MTRYGRRGHWRTNANGTIHWVKEHEVNRDNYTVIESSGNLLVNGQKMLESRCKYCYEKVYYVALSDNRDVQFNNNRNPLKIHNCRKQTEIVKRVAPLKKSKKYLNKSGALALDRRAEEQKENAERNRHLSWLNEISAKKPIDKATIKTQLLSANRPIWQLKILFSDGRSHLIDEITSELLDEAIIYIQKLKNNELNRKKRKKAKGPFSNYVTNFQRLIRAKYRKDFLEEFPLDAVFKRVKQIELLQDQITNLLQDIRIRQTKEIGAPDTRKKASNEPKSKSPRLHKTEQTFTVETKARVRLLRRQTLQK